jgi:hypothetical protein
MLQEPPAYSRLAEPADAGDPFFKYPDDETFVKSYQFNYDDVIAFNRELLYWTSAASCLIGVPIPCCLLPWALRNSVDAARAQHVAITRDGIRYVFDKHPTGCRFHCQDVGRTSKTVPFDKVTDCDIQEPAGMAFCCCVENTLHVVGVETANGRALTIAGLRNPAQFKKDVWAMKRGEGIQGVTGSVVPLAIVRVERTGASSGKERAGWLDGLWARGRSGAETEADDIEALPLILREKIVLLSVAVEQLRKRAEKVLDSKKPP